MADVPPTERELLEAIASQRDTVLDLDAVVDECRRAVHAHVGEFERDVVALDEAVGERDRAAAHLEHLISLHTDTEPPS
jgi:hypothetical protein